MSVNQGLGVIKKIKIQRTVPLLCVKQTRAVDYVTHVPETVFALEQYWRPMVCTCLHQIVAVPL
jgi:hypothetical protein